MHLIILSSANFNAIITELKTARGGSASEIELFRSPHTSKPDSTATTVLLRLLMMTMTMVLG